jgi:hypothetical protein
MKPLLFCLALAILAPPYVHSAPLYPQGLAAQLREIQVELDSKGASAVLAGLPATWDVATPERRYSISSEPLRSRLVSAETREANEWLDQVAQQLESFSKAPPEAIPNARGTLDRILARPEFAGVRPPSAWDLFRERVAAWIASLIQRLMGFASQHPTGGQILFWVLVIAAVGALAAWLIKIWTRRDPMLSLPRVNPAELSRSWEIWVRAAREAANQGNLREAIRCTYWAAVARLQENRVLPEDLTHTPREYLRLISAPEPFLQPLSSLTAGLERFWYGGQAAQLDDFQASLKQLEALGCKLD